MNFSILSIRAGALPLILGEAAPAAGGQPGAAPGGINPMMLMVLMMVVMYFVLIRPQRTRAKAQEEMQKAMQPGDEVVTIGGAHGVITSVREKTVLVRISEGKVEFDRSAIAQRVPKGDSAATAAK